VLNMYQAAHCHLVAMCHHRTAVNGPEPHWRYVEACHPEHMLLEEATEAGHVEWPASGWMQESIPLPWLTMPLCQHGSTQPQPDREQLDKQRAIIV